MVNKMTILRQIIIQLIGMAITIPLMIYVIIPIIHPYVEAYTEKKYAVVKQSLPDLTYDQVLSLSDPDLIYKYMEKYGCIENPSWESGSIIKSGITVEAYNLCSKLNDVRDKLFNQAIEQEKIKRSEPILNWANKH